MSLHKVDRAGMTGVQVGEGSLVEPRWVLVHPPLSTRIAAGKGPKQLRVGIRSDVEEIRLVELSDGQEEPCVIRGDDSVGSLVFLELRTEAASPVDVMDGLGEIETVDKFVDLAVPRLKPGGKGPWNGPVSPDGRHIICRLIGRPCSGAYLAPGLRPWCHEGWGTSSSQSPPAST